MTFDPGTWHCKVHQGATWIRTFTYDDGTGAVDLAGYTARFVIGSSTVTTLELDTALAGGVAIDGDTITVTITADQTADLTDTRYDYRLDIIDGDDVVTRLLVGTMTSVAEVGE